MKNSTLLFTALVTASLAFTGCRWLEVNPDQYILAEDALETPEDLQALLISCYDVLANLYDGDVQLLNELRGDHTNEPLSNNDLKAVYNRETIRWTSYVGGINRDFFYPVLRVNSLIDSFDLIEGLSSEDQNRMEAEGKFIRAFCFWGAVKMFAQPYGYTADNSHPGIPLPTYLRDAPFPRATVAQVYAQIEADLNGAIASLPEENGIYATKDAAKALLAQVHFLKMEFEQAASLAGEVIDSGRYSLEQPETDSAFVRLRLPIGSTSSESVFSIYSTLATNDNRTDQFVQWWQPTANPEITLTTEYWDWFQQIATGGAEDSRALWLDYQPTEGNTLLTRFADHSFFNVPLIHLTQLMLLRAECYGETGTNLALAIADINLIRGRAGITSAVYLLDNSVSTEDIITAARNEYRKETLGMGLWVEQLQRRGAMGEDITIRNAPWNCPGMALQFSASEGNVAGFEFNEVGGCN
jgi:hypothetical protein